MEDSKLKVNIFQYRGLRTRDEYITTNKHLCGTSQFRKAGGLFLRRLPRGKLTAAAPEFIHSTHLHGAATPMYSTGGPSGYSVEECKQAPLRGAYIPLRDGPERIERPENNRILGTKRKIKRVIG